MFINLLGKVADFPEGCQNIEAWQGKLILYKALIFHQENNDIQSIYLFSIFLATLYTPLLLFFSFFLICVFLVYIYILFYISFPC